MLSPVAHQCQCPVFQTIGSRSCGVKGEQKSDAITRMLSRKFLTTTKSTSLLRFLNAGFACSYADHRNGSDESLPRVPFKGKWIGCPSMLSLERMRACVKIPYLPLHAHSRQTPRTDASMRCTRFSFWAWLLQGMASPCAAGYSAASSIEHSL